MNSSRLETILFGVQKTKCPRGIHSKGRFQPLIIRESKIDLSLPNPFWLSKGNNTGWSCWAAPFPQCRQAAGFWHRVRSTRVIRQSLCLLLSTKAGSTEANVGLQDSVYSLWFASLMEARRSLTSGWGIRSPSHLEHNTTTEDLKEPCQLLLNVIFLLNLISITIN